MLLKSKTKNVTKMFKKMAVGAKDLKKRSMADSSDDSDDEMEAT